MFVEKKINILTELGLTNLQAKVYLAFLDESESTANEASKISGVARQEVYRVINELLQLGFLKRIIGSPTRYEPISFNVAIANSINEKRSKLSELEEQVEELLKNRVSETHEHVWKEFKFMEMQKNDKWFRSVNVFAGLKTHDLINCSRRYSQVLFSSDDVEEALKGGTKMRILIDEPQSNDSIRKKIVSLKKYPLFDARFLPDEPKAFFSVRDQKEVYLILDPSKSRGPPYLISNHPVMVELAQKYFDSFWLEATEFS
jgi:sugar-specific transcriptional regulator TrmB